MKTLKNTLILIATITLFNCSSDPTDPTDPCTDKKIVGLSLNEDPTNNTYRLADLTFGEFNGNGFVNTVPPTQSVTISELTLNDSNAFNPTANLYSFLMTSSNKITNFDKNTNLLSEVDLPVGFDGCKGLTYSLITDKYYTVQTNSTTITLHEFSNPTSSPIVFTNSIVLYTGADANDAVVYESYFGLTVDNQGTLFILNNKNIISVDIINFNSATPTFHTMGNTFQSVDKFCGIEYDQDNNRLLFLLSVTAAPLLELRATTLPLSANAFGAQVTSLNANYSDFNLEFNSTILACDGSYIISNHISNQSPINTRFILVDANNAVSTVSVSTHIFGLQKIN